MINYPTLFFISFGFPIRDIFWPTTFTIWDDENTKGYSEKQSSTVEFIGFGQEVTKHMEGFNYLIKHDIKDT